MFANVLHFLNPHDVVTNVCFV